MDDKKQPFEVTRILKKMDSETLRSLAAFENTKYFEILKEFFRRYAQTKKGDILVELNPYDPQRLAIDVAFRKGQVYSLEITIDIINGAKGELNKRKED